MARVAAFSVTFVISRRLGLDNLAVLTVAQSIVAYATVAGDAGLGTAAVTRIASGERAQLIVRGTARLQVVLSLVSTIVIVPIVAAASSWPLAVILATTPVAIALSTSYVLLARADARSVALSRIWGNVSTAFFGVTASLLGAPIWLVALAYPLGAVVATVFVNGRTGVHWRDLVGVPSWGFVRADSRHLSGLLLHTLVVHFYSSILVILASIVDGGAQLVEIALASRLLLLFSIPAQVLESVLLPRYAAAVDALTSRRVLRDAAVVVGGGIAAGAVIVVAAPFYVPLLFGVAAAEAVPAVQVILLQIPVSLLTSVLTVVLFARRDTLRLGAAYGVAAVVQLLVALFLASQDRSIAPAIVVSEVVFAVGTSIAVFSWRIREREER